MQPFHCEAIYLSRVGSGGPNFLLAEKRHWGIVVALASVVSVVSCRAMDDSLDLESHVSSGYEASVAETLAKDEDACDRDDASVPFRAIDLIQPVQVFRRPVLDRVRSEPEGSDAPAESGALAEEDGSGMDDWEHVGQEPGQHGLFGHEQFSEVSFRESADVVSEESLQLVEEVVQEPASEPERTDLPGPTITPPAWSEIVASGFGQYRQLDNMLRFPWETGILAEIFDCTQDPLPLCPGFPEPPPESIVGTSSESQLQLERFQMPHDAKYTRAVKSLQDMNYFEAKTQKLDLACAQWLNLLSIQWSSSGIGPQLVVALQRDSSGSDAFTVLKSCFGVKSPATLLKRASAFRQYVSWFNKLNGDPDSNIRPLPLDEEAVWSYFNWLRKQRQETGKGFTVPSSFLEAVRFAKFTLDLAGTDSILGSRRLLGFAALEKQAMGPSRQAPGMELEHLKRLHEVLKGDANNIDKLGAACFLICVYGRARWSDMRFIERVDVEEGESVTFYTAEHKTASVGLRRQQFLPIVVPWQGVVTDDWMNRFLSLYSCVGLDITRRPLGPLLPAPRLDGTFCARPLSTAEAADWLRALLEGTPDCSSFRSHSMKATLLGWCARAGLDKESRAVLGHHCSALSGSEVVYSRQLQIRALRKLAHILRRVRSGLALEDEAMREFGVLRTPAPFTPMHAAKTPLGPVAVEEAPNETAPAPASDQVLKDAVTAAVEAEELQSVKDEELDNSILENAAENLTLFPVELVSAGVVQIESSSGSDSSSSSYYSDSSSTEQPVRTESVRFTEEVPPDMDFYKHVKSGIVHCCKLDETVSKCKLNMSSNYKKLARKFHFKHPKCLRCFPKDGNRIRSIEQLTESLDGALKKAKS